MYKMRAIIDFVRNDEIDQFHRNFLQIACICMRARDHKFFYCNV